ncbi:MAG: SRPBCC family protein [Anaerolineae bacterium]
MALLYLCDVLFVSNLSCLWRLTPTHRLLPRKKTLIAAPIEKVWAVQSDIDRWADWQPDVASAKLEGTLAAGTGFR